MTESEFIRGLAVLLGLIAILAPLARVIASRRRPIERTVGRGQQARRWPATAVITLFLASIGISLWRPIPLAMTSTLERVSNYGGFLVYLVGIALYLWGLAALGSRFGVSSIAGADLHAGHELVTRGPYKFIRHPMYLGVLLAAPGALLLFRTWAMLLFAPSALVVVLRAEREERLLEQAYAEHWLQYAERVPRWLPRLW